MDRRHFLAASGIGLSGFMIPGFGNAVAAEALLTKHAPQADETPSVVEAAAEEAIVTEAVETDAPATEENKEG